ncbi:hypothetical protein N7714_03770 [Pseudomonas aeruginosa]|uniref:hypothetical protein n=1 Tax=Pseudomonas aeruginosa TaxID=287 RepID=UPI0024495654|nr:hypothetical protein [Pseudomonas aeruginosa]MDG9800865.1 hypothetical protein [Pseudomonas aeruginosa]MDG9904920.1 hypothetical protein [Pseudomonas aeruginosa]MDH0001554.1 hypothetical protein [Pseudomonas aeruginosa]MDH0009402.1 hypothetical protein [Pseudomonas aeruginosa]MDH0594817.1 hypothetical protein [Pseudomonas aeruginosa]
MIKRTLYHFHFCCGLGGGAAGFNRARPRIGNAVPPAAAEAIAGVMGTTLLLAEQGETFMLSNTPIWVRPVAVALSVAQQEVQP